MTEIRNQEKAVQVIGNGLFYGYYFSGSYGRQEFQVVDAIFDFTDRKYKNFLKKYGF